MFSIYNHLFVFVGLQRNYISSFDVNPDSRWLVTVDKGNNDTMLIVWDVSLRYNDLTVKMIYHKIILNIYRHLILILYSNCYYTNYYTTNCTN